MYLWKKHGSAPQFAAFPEDFDAVHKAGLAAVGSPETVRALLASEIGQSGVNYLLCRFAFGDLTLQESLRSVEMFSQDVQPHFTGVRTVTA
jgi:alkanesulfonate monooxygenase SsuD/methylene tetrahydromethanopterin reductase-like flavin-dependent oxidoreductase (luciferase family)